MATENDLTLRQWSIWSPAMAGTLALGAAMGLLFAFVADIGWRLGASAVAAALWWWLIPRLGFTLWVEDGALCWRWGIVHHLGVQRLSLSDIATVEVITLPDLPQRPTRECDGITLHGGNFTPKLNRGVLITLKDGRRLCFGLPQPKRFADGLRHRLSTLTAAP
jgi:hypothetical protein